MIFEKERDFFGAIRTGLKDSEIQPDKEISGYLSEGGKEVESFKSINDIPNIYLHTDLPESGIWMLGKNKYLKPEDFYGIPQKSLILSYYTKESKTSDILKHKSELFSRIASILFNGNLSELKNINYLYNYYSLDDHNKKDFMSPLWQLSYLKRVEYEFGIPQHEEDTLEFVFSMHPWSYAQNIISTRVPKGNWEVFTNWVSPYKDDKLNWIKSENRPVFVEISVFGENKASNQKIMNSILGLRGKQFLYAERKSVFLTGQELLWLADKTQDFEIKKTWVCDGWTSIEKPEELMVKDDPLKPYSVANSLIAINKVVGLMSPKINKKHEPIPDDKMIWMRAKDRILMADMALDFINNGFYILSHGEGWLKIAFNQKNIKSSILVNLLIKHKLMFPPAWLKNINVTDIYNNKFLEDEYIADIIFKKINPNYYIFIDRIVSPWYDNKKETSDRLQSSVKKISEINVQTNNPQFISSFNEKLLEQAKTSVNKIKNEY